MNLNTRLADKKYGPDWLDLTEEEEFARGRCIKSRARRSPESRSQV